MASAVPQLPAPITAARYFVSASIVIVYRIVFVGGKQLLGAERDSHHVQRSLRRKLPGEIAIAEEVKRPHGAPVTRPLPREMHRDYDSADRLRGRAAVRPGHTGDTHPHIGA